MLQWRVSLLTTSIKGSNKLWREEKNNCSYREKLYLADWEVIMTCLTDQETVDNMNDAQNLTLTILDVMDGFKLMRGRRGLRGK